MSPLFRIRRAIPGLAILALLVGASFQGCQPGSRSEALSEATLADSLADGYQWLEKQYDRMGAEMPSVMREMRGRMQAMRGRMMSGQDSVRSGRGKGGMMGRMRGMMGRMKNRMGRRGGTPSSRDTTDGRFRMGHRNMGAMHETMARMLGKKRTRMAAWHRKMARWHEKMMGGSSDEPSRAPGENTEVPDDAARSGATLFTQQCASCHGQNGRGISGTFPPLAGSEWVTGDASVLARIVLHGLEGPVEVQGQRYNGVMPAFGSRLSDPEVAELLTFLRTSLNEGGSPVTAEEIARLRQAYADRSQAWTAETLSKERAGPSTNEDSD